MTLSHRSGTVIAGFGRDTIVRTEDGAVVKSIARSRRVQPVCGDRVMLSDASAEPAVIEAVAPRRTEFARSSLARSKVVAANVTQVVILVACEPSFSDELVSRLVVAAERTALSVVLALNKIDIVWRLAEARRLIGTFRGIGYPIVELAGELDPSPLRPFLVGHRSLLAGQSGMGKSSLVKALVPEAEVRIGEISRFLDSGRQSTTASRLYEIDAVSEIVDSPGLAEFGLAGIRARELAAGFREFIPHTGRCRFQDCRHLAEPSCEIRAATLRGLIHPRRLELYQRIAQLEAAR